MKLSFTILILLLAILSYGQTLDELRKRLSILQAGREFSYDTTGFASLPRIDYKCDNKNKSPVDYFHVEDLNGDGFNDLIYSGPCEGANQTGIFLNTGRVFRKVYDNVGKILSIEKADSETKIYIFKEACCCDFFSQYTQITINKKSEITRNTIVFGAQTKISVSSRFKEDKAMGTIRTTPEVNDVVKRDDCNNSVKRNQLTRISDFRNIIQVNRVGSWWLVWYPESGERSWIGWMKLD